MSKKSWKKLGRVYVAAGHQDWAQSHAFIPTSMMLDHDRIRVYAAFLDHQKVGRIGYVDLNAKNPLEVLKISDRPVLDIGQAGAFDDNGVSPLCIIEYRNQLRLYYVGWQLGVQARYFLFTGLALSEDGGESFQRWSRTPVLERSDKEFFLRSAAHVHLENGRWKAWYVAGNNWLDLDGKQIPTYNIRYLESGDGIGWGPQGEVCLDFANDDEFGFGRPYVSRENESYRMWYSIRTISKGYRIGYAESGDGRHWLRKDQEAGIDVSGCGWDSQMVCFACIQKTRYGTYMFYNGNNYGESGFGAALLEPL
jgi:hypothetical protein